METANSKNTIMSKVELNENDLTEISFALRDQIHAIKENSEMDTTELEKTKDKIDEHLPNVISDQIKIFL